MKTQGKKGDFERSQGISGEIKQNWRTFFVLQKFVLPKQVKEFFKYTEFLESCACVTP